MNKVFFVNLSIYYNFGKQDEVSFDANASLWSMQCISNKWRAYWNILEDKPSWILIMENTSSDPNITNFIKDRSIYVRMVLSTSYTHWDVAYFILRKHMNFFTHRSLPWFAKLLWKRLHKGESFPLGEGKILVGYINYLVLGSTIERGIYPTDPTSDY